MDPT